jgi:hemerythrin-like domain-containing protein
MAPRRDAITLLKEDHKTVKGLIGELERAAERNGSKSQTLLERVESELKQHTTIEEEIFYPAFRTAVSKKEDQKLYYEALEEHHVVDVVLPEISETTPGSPEFAAKVKVLKDLVEHHVKEEEGEMFPRARKAMDKGQLQGLAADMEARKEELGGEHEHEDEGDEAGEGESEKDEE